MKKNLFFLSVAFLALFAGYAQELRNMQWLTWVNSPIVDKVGAASGYTGPWAIYHRYDVEDLTPYVGQYIAKIKYKPLSDPMNQTVFLANPRIKIWAGGYAIEEPGYSLYEPKKLLVDVEIPEYHYNYYNYVDLPVPVPIDGKTMLWIGIEYKTASGKPVGVTNPGGSVSYFQGKSNVIDIGQIYYTTSTDPEAYPGTDTKFCWDLAAYTRDALPLSKCSVTVEMDDIFHDGWQGAYITFVDDNGVEWDRVTVNKYGKTATVKFPRDAKIKCIWNKGESDSDVSFVIKNAEGTALYTCATGAFAAKPNGEFFNFTASCYDSGQDCEEAAVVSNVSGAMDGIPINSYYSASYSQQLFTPADLGIFPGEAHVSAVAFKYKEYQQMGPITRNNITIYLGNTTKTKFNNNTDWVPLAQLQQVFTGTVTFNEGTANEPWTTIFFDNSFQYQGGNLVLAVHNNDGGPSGITMGSFVYDWLDILDWCAINGSVGYGTINDLDNPGGYNWSSVAVTMRSQTKFQFCSTYEIAQPCYPITNLAAHYEPHGTSLQLTWDASASATGYNVYRNNYLIGDNITTTSFTDDYFNASETYIYVVSSVCNDKESDVLTITIAPPLEVVSTLPANNATDVALNTELSVTFNQNVTAVGLTGITINGKKATGTISGNKLTIAHNNFGYDTLYTVVIPKGAINNYKEIITWSFTTVKEPAPQTYTITASLLTGGGTITPMGATTVEEGSNLTFTITPNQNCKILQVPVDGNNNPQAVATGSYTFSNIKANHTIEASFECESVRENDALPIQIYSYLNVINVINDVNILIKKLEVIDMLGRTIWQGAAPDAKTEIVLNAAPGIYAVRITTDATIITSKILIK